MDPSCSSNRHLEPEDSNKESICLPQKRKSCSQKHPGFVGDGTMKEKYKLCNCLVDINTLICDKCEELFHLTCLKQKVNPKEIDDWYCPTCQNDIKTYERKKAPIGSNYQAEVPEEAKVPEDICQPPESSEVTTEVYLGVNLPEDGWMDTNWQPADSVPPNEEQYWLQCKRIIYMKGEIGPDGKKTREDIRCGKWRRAPFWKDQTDIFDCSSAVLWDPRRADCNQPQELETGEIQKRMKASRRIRAAARAQARARAHSMIDI